MVVAVVVAVVTQLARRDGNIFSNAYSTPKRKKFEGPDVWKHSVMSFFLVSGDTTRLFIKIASILTKSSTPKNDQTISLRDSWTSWSRCSIVLCPAQRHTPLLAPLPDDTAGDKSPTGGALLLLGQS